ncbi:unnamed protein product [Boreogadus saida]
MCLSMCVLITPAAESLLCSERLAIFITGHYCCGDVGFIELSFLTRSLRIHRSDTIPSAQTGLCEEDSSSQRALLVLMKSSMPQQAAQGKTTALT